MENDDIIENRIEDLPYYLKNIKNFLAPEIIDVCFALFKKFSKDNGQTILVKDFPNMMRLMNLNPTNKELNEMIELFKSEPNEDKTNMSFEEFVICVARKRRESDTIEELMACFRILDKDATGKIPEPTLRYYLCNMADRFENEEIDAFMKEATPFVEVINEVKFLNYKDFALFLKDLYQAPVVDPKAAKGGKNNKKK